MLLCQTQRHLIEHLVFLIVRNAEIIHHPFLRSIKPFGIARQTILVSYKPVVARIFRSFGIMKTILNVPFFIGRKTNFLHHVHLLITRRCLHTRIIVGHDAIHAVLALNIIRLQVFIRAIASHLQVAIIKRADAGEHGPFFPADIHVEMSRFLIVGRRITCKGFPCDIGLISH
ncbi:hypothetical protein DSECCO2_600560 [anaerobic digester metagenome]